MILELWDPQGLWKYVEVDGGSDVRALRIPAAETTGAHGITLDGPVRLRVREFYPYALCDKTIVFIELGAESTLLSLKGS